jgi:hypothetical protein
MPSVAHRTIHIVFLSVVLLLLLLLELTEILYIGYNVSAFQFSTLPFLTQRTPTTWPTACACAQSRCHDRRRLDVTALVSSLPVYSRGAAFRQSSPLQLETRQATRCIKLLFASPLSSSSRPPPSSSFNTITSMLDKTMKRLNLQGEKFERWRHLQKLLDNETNPLDTNRLVYGVLERYYNVAKKTKVSSMNDDDDDIDDIDTSPERTTERLLAIGKILQEYSSPLDQSLDLISSSASSSSFAASDEENGNDDDSLVVSTGNNKCVLSPLQQALMDILPHPVNEEDDHKSTWEIVMELHGREGVRIEEQTPNNRAWKERCLAARVLIYYDFLDYAPE